MRRKCLNYILQIRPRFSVVFTILKKFRKTESFLLSFCSFLIGLVGLEPFLVREPYV